MAKPAYLPQVSRHQIDQYHIEGLSMAGVGTCLRVPELGLCFDLAQGFIWAAASELFLITHGHMDHAGGLPYIVSQRALNDLKPGRFVMPDELVEPIDEILKKWSEIEGHEYEYELIPMKAGESIAYKNHFRIEAFKTVHRVACQGYTIFQNKRVLKKEFETLTKDQISKIAREGREVTEERETPFFAFTGDTQVEVLDLSPEIKKAKFLVLEVTYFDDRKSVASAREWGHIHLDELIPRLSEFENEKVFLNHTSRRYRKEEAEEILRKRIPHEYKDKFVLF